MSELNKSIIENQELCEIEIAKNLNVKPNNNILELGCGCGRIAYHISKLTDCKVYGINIDEKQLDDAKKYTKLYDKTKFIRAREHSLSPKLCRVKRFFSQIILKN